jgi:predicted XRE-type DNA-binding protein
MNKAKKKRLATAGWKTGDVSEFLGLSLQERQFIEIKLAFATAFKEQRKARKLTQKQVADIIHSSQSRVARLEAADPSVSVDLMLQSLLALDIPILDIAKTLSAVPKPTTTETADQPAKRRTRTVSRR